jgi:hypothetical protein
MKIVVGLAGGKRVGKDTTAGILIEKFKNVYPVHTIAFADPIKDMLKVLLNYTGMNDANFCLAGELQRERYPVCCRWVDSTYRNPGPKLWEPNGGRREMIKGSLWVDVVRKTHQSS